jgi:hypothetical protein
MRKLKSTTKAPIINTTSISTQDFIQGRKGSYRVIVKCRAGFFTIQDVPEFDVTYKGFKPVDLLNRWKKGALLSIQFRADKPAKKAKNDIDPSWLTVFAKKGKNIVTMDEEIMRELKVGDINQIWTNTNLYSQHQYAAVNSSNWDSYAFQMNTKKSKKK